MKATKTIIIFLFCMSKLNSNIQQESDLICESNLSLGRMLSDVIRASFVRSFFSLWFKLIPLTSSRYKDHGGCDGSTGDTFSSWHIIPYLFFISRDLCLSYSQFCIFFAIYEIVCYLHFFIHIQICICFIKRNASIVRSSEKHTLRSTRWFWECIFMEQLHPKLDTTQI